MWHTQQRHLAPASEGGVGKVEQFEDDVLKVKFLEGRRRKNFQKFRSLLQT